jgi:hypothetical protein
VYGALLLYSTQCLQIPLSEELITEHNEILSLNVAPKNFIELALILYFFEKSFFQENGKLFIELHLVLFASFSLDFFFIFLLAASLMSAFI